MPSPGVNPFGFLDKLFTAKTRVLGLSVDEGFVIACIVLIQYQHVTDRQTDNSTAANTGSAEQAMLTPCKMVFIGLIRDAVNTRNILPCRYIVEAHSHSGWSLEAR